MTSNSKKLIESLYELEKLEILKIVDYKVSDNFLKIEDNEAFGSFMLSLLTCETDISPLLYKILYLLNLEDLKNRIQIPSTRLDFSFSPSFQEIVASGWYNPTSKSITIHISAPPQIIYEKAYYFIIIRNLAHETMHHIIHSYIDNYTSRKIKESLYFIPINEFIAGVVSILVPYSLFPHLFKVKKDDASIKKPIEKLYSTEMYKVLPNPFLLEFALMEVEKQKEEKEFYQTLYNLRKVSVSEGEKLGLLFLYSNKMEVGLNFIRGALNKIIEITDENELKKFFMRIFPREVLNVCNYLEQYLPLK